MAYEERKRRDPMMAMEMGNDEGETHENASDWWSGDGKGGARAKARTQPKEEETSGVHQRTKAREKC